MYGSSFWCATLNPWASRRRPIDALVRPFPRLLTTPPVTKLYLAPSSLPGKAQDTPRHAGGLLAGGLYGQGGTGTARPSSTLRSMDRPWRPSRRVVYPAVLLLAAGLVFWFEDSGTSKPAP